MGDSKARQQRYATITTTIVDMYPIILPHAAGGSPGSRCEVLSDRGPRFLPLSDRSLRGFLVMGPFCENEMTVLRASGGVGGSEEGCRLLAGVVSGGAIGGCALGELSSSMSCPSWECFCIQSSSHASYSFPSSLRNFALPSAHALSKSSRSARQLILSGARKSGSSQPSQITLNFLVIDLLKLA